jgi:hypothetical protein
VTRRVVLYDSAVVYRRLAVAFLVLPALTACTHSVPSRANNNLPSSAADPKAVLAASTAGLAAGNYRYTVMQPGMTVGGVVHLPSHSWSEETTIIDGTERQVVNMRVIGLDEYTQPDAKSGGWTHIDLSRVPETRRNGLTLDVPDRTGATKLLATAQSATVNGSTVSGKLDVFQLTSGGITLEALRSRLFLPSAFTAKLDSQGRLVQLVLDLPASLQPNLPAGTWKLDVTDYGTVTPPQAPPKFTEEPDDFYRSL